MIFAALTQETALALGTILTVLGTGVAGFLTLVGKKILDFLRDYHSITESTSSKKLEECVAQTTELRTQLAESRATFDDMKALSADRAAEIATLRAERLEKMTELSSLRAELKSMQTKLQEANEKLQSFSMTVAKNTSVIAEKFSHPALSGPTDSSGASQTVS